MAHCHRVLLWPLALRRARANLPSLLSFRASAVIPVFGVVAIAGSLMVGMGIVGYAILAKFGTFGAHGAATAQERLPLQPRHP